MDADGLRTEYVKGLAAEATRRFGAAGALAQTIADVVGWITEIATLQAPQL
jgi:hypothetical protein